MALTGRTTIDPPPTTAPSYGLYSVATVTTDAGTGDRWEAGGAEYTSVMCAQGTVWAVGCGPAFTATITKTAVANQWQVALAPTVGPYEFSVNGGAYAAMVNGGTFTVPNANSTVVIRETTGLRRRVTFNGVSNVAATNTTQTATSSTRAYNDPKTGDGKSWTTSDPFTVLAGVSCGSLGTLGVDDQARALAALGAAEQRLVEATFEQGNIDPRLAAAGAVVTPAGTGAIKVKRAIGALEAYLRAEYGGTGVLHASPALAEYMAPTKDGAVLRTKLGTPIAFGAGYTGVAPAGTAPAADQLWIYATGAVAVRRSAVDVPATGAETLDRVTNQTLLIAERAIMVSIDCVPVAAALVDLAAEDA
jgi:hypothetical protein